MFGASFLMAEKVTYMSEQWVEIATTESASETKQVAAALAMVVGPGDVITLDGDLGAGKTQFTQGIAEELDIEGPVTSPTFNLVITYDDGCLPLHHFDLYRLESPEELEDIDFYGIVEGDGVSCIEWASKFPDDMPEDRLEVYLEVAPISTDGNSRHVKARAFGSASQLLDFWQQALK